MTRRQRRALSESTVATIDESSIQYYLEESVLKPASARAHTDDWPCFLLNDATIYHKDGTLANLLHVDLEGPFIVRGRLEIEKDQERFLVNRHMKDRTPWIQIQNTLSFSIGLKDDDLPMPVLWASGGAGWFEIVPSDTYRAICDTMSQGISLHYFILDYYEAALVQAQSEDQGKNKTLTLEDISVSQDRALFSYAVSVGDGMTLPEVRQRVKDQAIFLLSHFPKNTEFHEWLTGQFPEIARKLAKKDSNKSTTESSHLVAIPYMDQPSPLEVVDSKRKGKATLRSSVTRTMRSSEAPSSEMMDPSSEVSGWENKVAQAKRDFFKKLQSEPAYGSDVAMLDVIDKNPSSIATSNTQIGHHNLQPSSGTNMPRRNSLEQLELTTRIRPSANPSLSTIIEALQDSRKEMIESMFGGKQKKHPDDVNPKGWCTRLYLELSIRNTKAPTEVCQYYAQDLLQLLGSEWHHSEFYKWLEDNITTKPSFEYISEEDLHKIVRRKKKSRASREEAQSSVGPFMDGNESTPRMAGKQPVRRGRPSGKTSVLRPSFGSKKRLYNEAGFEDDEMEIDENGMPRTSKRSRYPTEDDETQDTDSSDSDDEHDENKDMPLARVIIYGEKLPSTTPTGPNQTWICEEPDCGYVVRDADQKKGQIAINQHFEYHDKVPGEVTEEDAISQKSLVSLALKESQKGQLPIDHLLEKIRTIGDKTEKRQEKHLNGKALPQHIKRALLI